MSEVKQRLSRLRAQMKRYKLDAYFIPSTDPHQSEYVPPCWQRRVWISGFTGSAGDVVVTTKKAGLWTDGRYHLQASQQLSGSTIKLFKAGNIGVPTVPQWLEKTLKKGQVLGVDPRVLSRGMAAELDKAAQAAGARLKLVDKNLVDTIWSERPSRSKAPMEVLPRRLTGLSAGEKLTELRKAMKQKRVKAHVLSALDAIAWLFNIRSADVDHNPVAIAYAIVTPKKATLYTDLDKVTPTVKARLKGVRFADYGEAAAGLAALKKKKARVWLDGGTVNMWVVNALKGCDLSFDPSPVFAAKARKNATEVKGIKAALRRDGVAMVRFLAWLDRAVGNEELTEFTIMGKLEAFRAEGENFRGTSFTTIAGYNQNGAIIHYEATEDTAAALQPEGMLLVDSGGQYTDGTTDITRTVWLGGEPTDEQKDRYTRVLRGHINLARCRFPAGTVGKQLDTFARAPLWETGLNYNHGTGHGVGHFLNVHEGPQSLSPVRCTGWALEPGNLMSNEPGFYQEGGYGIRIENLVLVVKDDELSSDEAGDWLRFDTLTLCPIDTRLVDRKLLTPDEKRWLNAYHATVRDALSDGLDPAAARWLRSATKKL